MKDMVKVTCYGKTETMERKDAISKFSECIMWSDGSEMERYAMILAGLTHGETEVSDEW